jgi:predicted O-methyltransferase YrrM
MLSPAAEEILLEYNARLAKEEVAMKAALSSGVALDRDTLLLTVGEEPARFLHALAVARGAKHILEIGTSYGYSTLFLASAAKTSGGTLTTLELSPEKQAYARSMLTRAGLSDSVNWCLGDAVQIIQDLDGPFDFVLLDLWKELYIPCLERFYPKLAPQGIIVADNMLHPPLHRAEAEAYRAAVAAKPDLQSVLLPIGSGMELSCRWDSTSMTPLLAR